LESKRKNVSLFSNETFEKRPITIIQESDFHSDHHFKAQLLGNRLYSFSIDSSILNENKIIAELTFENVFN